LSRTFKALLAACAATLVIAPNAWATHDGKPSPRSKDAREFIGDVPVSRIVHHQFKLQEIARANADTRTVLSGGYMDSLDYVESTLEHAGYKPKRIDFNFPFWEETAPAVIRRVSPTPVKEYRYGTEEDSDSPDVDFITLGYSGTGTLTNTQVVPTNDIGTIPPATAGSSTSGCELSDYPASVVGKVALVMRGTCAFVQKAEVAQQAGAAGVIIFNDGVGAGRQNPLFVLNQVDLHIPAVISSFAMGKELYDAVNAGQDVRVDFSAFGTLTDRFLPQIYAETKGGDPNNVLIVGAHLDSVPAGPGINDDGSGTAMLLAQAEAMAKKSNGKNVRQKIRFMWFGAEEDGLVGSQYYAHDLSDAEVAKVDGMLDYDMLASSNYIRMVYDGDGSSPGNDPFKGPPGSGLIEEIQKSYFTSKGQQTEPTPFDGRSDYVGFTDRGIPAGGIFAGAEGVKTEAQEAVYGGDAGSWYDPCYHQLCDDFITLLTSMPPAALVENGGAEGLESEDETPTVEERQAASRKMRGGALRGLNEMSDAASYTVWYFSSTKNPWGEAKAKSAKAKKLRKAKRSYRKSRKLKRVERWGYGWH
jgi:Zn-dependent M28 family amino/carboxypeptidase